MLEKTSAIVVALLNARPACFNRTTRFSPTDVVMPWSGMIEKSSSPQMISWTEPWWELARLYAGDELVANKFYNGQPFDIALRPVPSDQRGTLELRVMPLHPQSAERIPASMRPSTPAAAPRAEVERINALERRHMWLAFPIHAR